jgi:hypothetical protein
MKLIKTGKTNAILVKYFNKTYIRIQHCNKNGF